MAKRTKAAGGGGFLELIKTLVYALILAGLIRTLLFQPFWIPSGSMKSTLLIGDFLFVNKFAYGYSAASCPSYKDFNLCGVFDDRKGRLFGDMPERGDVIVFRHPSTGQDYIKRLIGLPGDTVEIRNGVLYLNGDVVPQEPDGQFTEIYEPQGPAGTLPRCLNDGPVGIGGTCVKERAIETLPGGRSHAILDVGRTSSDDRGPFTVPEGRFFFMGDNRDNSIDSRFSQAASGVGFVPYENLIGRADRIMFSSGGASMLYFWTWRRDRFFLGVN